MEIIHGTVVMVTVTVTRIMIVTTREDTILIMSLVESGISYLLHSTEDGEDDRDPDLTEEVDLGELSEEEQEWEDEVEDDEVGEDGGE
jgi:hypothetical protein